MTVHKGKMGDTRLRCLKSLFSCILHKEVPVGTSYEQGERELRRRSGTFLQRVMSGHAALLVRATPRWATGRTLAYRACVLFGRYRPNISHAVAGDVADNGIRKRKTFFFFLFFLFFFLA